MDRTIELQRLRVRAGGFLIDPSAVDGGQIPDMHARLADGYFGMASGKSGVTDGQALGGVAADRERTAGDDGVDDTCVRPSGHVDLKNPRRSV
ncbi:hypothetical protein JCM9957A_18170 [Kineosporia succinea]